MRFERLWTTLLVLILLCLLHLHLPLTTADDVKRPEKEGTPRQPALTNDHQPDNVPTSETIKRGGGGGGRGGGGGGRGGVRGGRGSGAWIPYYAAGGGASSHRSHHNGTNKGIHDGIYLGLLCSVLLVLVTTVLLP